MPLNVYGAFGRTSVITNWCADNYGYQLLHKIICIISKEHVYHVYCWLDVQTENNEIYV